MLLSRVVELLLLCFEVFVFEFVSLFLSVEFAAVLALSVVNLQLS